MALSSRTLTAFKLLSPGLYYCHLYTSCECGSNENANRLIRRYLPKGQSMRKATQRDCDFISRNLNSMHRKVLDYRTAVDLSQAHLAALAGN